MSDPAFEAWKRDRAEAAVPEGFADRVMEAAVPSPLRLGAFAKAALLLLAVGALLFRMGSTLALILIA